jgi:hypothetical protein
LAFGIIALYSFEPSLVENQLLMAVLWKDGTGKNRAIHAIEILRSGTNLTSFGRADEVALIATTGAAASNIGGSTTHSAALFP